MNAIVDGGALIIRRKRLIGGRTRSDNDGAEPSRDESVEVPPLKCDVRLPLVIALDNCLLNTDSRHEASLIRFKRRWLGMWQFARRGIKGSNVEKDELEKAILEEDVAWFPGNPAMEKFARREAQLGRKVVLVTMSESGFAKKFEKRFPFVSTVIASDRNRSLKGRVRSEELRRHYPDGFVYAGASYADLHVWKLSSGAVVAAASARLAQKVRGIAEVVASVPSREPGLERIGREMRLHHWVKNALIFIPLILGGEASDAHSWVRALCAFMAFSLLASATYIVNDLWDLHDDRLHWSKRHRPLARGELSLGESVALLAGCGLGSFALALSLGLGAVATLALYLVLSLAYSMMLKREPIVDVLLLATLFTTRLAIGVVVTGVAFSPWLMVLSMFIFLSLSLAKRYGELSQLAARGQHQMLGRGYRAGDGPFVLATGIASMTAAVLVMSLYITQEAFPRGFYRHAHFLWGFAVIIFLWLARVWLRCHRGELEDDPVSFALRDRLSLAYAALMGLILLVAIL